jgi:3-dehydroquinate synthase
VRIERLLKRLALPVRLELDRGTVLDALRRDKKREGEGIHFALLHGIGNAVVEKIAMKELEIVVSEVNDES